MTSYNFGDIVLVPFPFTDQTTTKKRPAVVVSSEDYQNHRPDLILMAVTSQSRPTLDFGEMAVTEWKKVGLLKAFSHQAGANHSREETDPEEAWSARRTGSKKPSRHSADYSWLTADALTNKLKKIRSRE